MYVSCINFNEKIRMYLIDYNAFVPIRKYASNLFNNEKIKQYAYSILKIQIEQLNKKQKQSANTMKMISDCFCQSKIQLTNYENIFL